MANFRVQIPEPCPMSMADMVPVQNGYHCARCEKTVVDFRTYSTDEIQAYFKNKDGQRVCGILPSKTGEELPAITVTADCMHQGVSRLFFAALLLVFTHLFIGCGSTDIRQELEFEAQPLLGLMIPEDISWDTLLTDSLTVSLPEQGTLPVPAFIACDFYPYTEDLDSLASVPEPDLIPLEPEHFEVLGNMVYSSMPQFPGGEDALSKYLQKHLHTRKNEKGEPVVGRIYVSFAVTEDGKVEDVEIKHGIQDAPYLNAEVTQVMQRMPKWKPGTSSGKPERINYQLSIDFRE